MNRRLKSFAIGGFVLLILALAGWLYRHRPEPLPVLYLADGSELRLRGVGWSGKPTICFEPLLWSAFKRVVPTRWRAVFGEPVGMLWHRCNDGVSLGFTWVRPARNASLRCQVWHLGGDGTETPVSAANLSAGAQVIVAYRFPQVSWRDERLRFRLRDGKNDLEFSLPNPRRGEVFPQWTPEPLPETRSVDGFEFTLASLQPVENPRTPGRPAWTPELRIRGGGTDATGWFGLSHIFVDPTGNRSAGRLAATEAVWRVHVTAVPTLEFPFPATAISVQHNCPVPGPGESRRLPAAAGATASGLDSVWLTGPGNFEFRAGTNAFATSAAGPIQERLDPGPRGVVRYAAQEPQLWWRSQVAIADEADESPRLWQPRVRRADGRPVKLKPLRSSYGEDSQLEHLPNGTGLRRNELHRYQLPADLVGEPITVEVICLVPLRVEFSVAAPNLP